MKPALFHTVLVNFYRRLFIKAILFGRFFIFLPARSAKEKERPGIGVAILSGLPQGHRSAFLTDEFGFQYPIDGRMCKVTIVSKVISYVIRLTR